MKNLWIKGWSGLALTLAANAAFSTPVVITSTAATAPKILATSSAVFEASNLLRGTLNAFNVVPARGNLSSIEASAGATASIGYRNNNITRVTTISALSFSMPVTSMTYESVGQAIVGNTLQGDIKIVVPQNVSNVFARGGELTIKDMRVDHITKTIYATVVGGNGYGVQQNVPFFNYTEAKGSTTFPGGNVQTTLGPIRLTLDGVNAWGQSLGLTNDGKRSLLLSSRPVDSYGAINTYGTFVITTNTVPVSPPVTPDDPACKLP
jgi:hypothetical protein